MARRPHAYAVCCAARSQETPFRRSHSCGIALSYLQGRNNRPSAGWLGRALWRGRFAIVLLTAITIFVARVGNEVC